MHQSRDLTDEQWLSFDPLIPEPIKRRDGRGRPWNSRLFAALAALQGQVISMCDDCHRHREWLKFLRAIDYVVPADRQST